MKQITLTLCAVAFIIASCNNEKKTNEDKTGETKTTETSTGDMKDKAANNLCEGIVADTASAPMDSAMMAAWGVFMTPADPHKMLAKDDGEWTGEVTSWMDPAAPPSNSKAIATNKMIMGGRYQMSEHKGCFNGMPFEGMSIVGYDNGRKVFMSTWIDNFGSSFMNLEGPWDAAAKTIHLKGKSTDPMSGKQVAVREEFIYVDDNTQKLEMYMPDMKGKEFKTMEIVFKRKK